MRLGAFLARQRHLKYDCRRTFPPEHRLRTEHRCRKYQKTIVRPINTAFAAFSTGMAQPFPGHRPFSRFGDGERIANTPAPFTCSLILLRSVHVFCALRRFAPGGTHATWRSASRPSLPASSDRETQSPFGATAHDRHRHRNKDDQRPRPEPEAKFKLI